MGIIDLDYSAELHALQGSSTKRRFSNAEVFVTKDVGIAALATLINAAGGPSKVSVSVIAKAM